MRRSVKGYVRLMYKIAVVGDYDSIYGFAALGLETYAVNTAEEARSAVNTLAVSEFGVIYITEGLAAELSDVIETYRNRPMPAIILIPGIHGNTGAGVAGVRQTVEKAVGSDILFSHE